MFRQMHASSTQRACACVALSISFCLSACTTTHQVQGPTLHISPKTGENSETYRLEDQGCRTTADHELNPKTGNNRTGFNAQRAYDRIYEKCMLDLGYLMPPQSFWYKPAQPGVLYLPPRPQGTYP